ncbi:Electron transfer flavoprotein subunit beta [compost metagenome]
MKAKKKPLDVLTAASLNVDPSPRLKTLRVEEPVARKPGVLVPDVATLLDKLKNEAKVI